MNDDASIFTWDILGEFGFVPDSTLLSSDKPGLSLNLGLHFHRSWHPANLHGGASFTRPNLVDAFLRATPGRSRTIETV